VDTATNDVACNPGEIVRLTAGTTAFDFNCDVYAGITDPLPAGDYSARLELLAADGTVEDTQPVAVSVFGGRVTDIGMVTFSVAPAAQNGSVHFTWEIRVGTATGSPGMCASGEFVTLDFVGYTKVQTQCAGMDVTVDNLPPGSYMVDATLTLGTTVESMTSAPISFDVPSGGMAPDQHIVFVVSQ
jgi:hypothetical protein